jgi:hypothetical protein
VTSEVTLRAARYLRREQNRKLFSPPELIILIIAVVGFVTGIVALATGAITI